MGDRAGWMDDFTDINVVELAEVYPVDGDDGVFDSYLLLDQHLY